MNYNIQWEVHEKKDDTLLFLSILYTVLWKYLISFLFCSYFPSVFS